MKKLSIFRDLPGKTLPEVEAWLTENRIEIEDERITKARVGPAAQAPGEKDRARLNVSIDATGRVVAVLGVY